MTQVDVDAANQTGFPLRGEIFDVDLEPVVGSEIGKRRPALVLSNDLSNRYASTVTVIPITSQPAKRQYPFEVLVPEGIGGLTRDSRLKTNQVRTIDKRRLVTKRGVLPGAYMPKVEKALKIHLGMA